MENKKNLIKQRLYYPRIIIIILLFLIIYS